MLWVNSARRWCTGFELLALQGVLAYRTLLLDSALPSSSFALTWRPNERSRNSTQSQAGNAMHIQVAGMVDLYGICYIRKYDSGLLSTILRMGNCNTHLAIQASKLRAHLGSETDALVIDLCGDSDED